MNADTDPNRHREQHLRGRSRGGRHYGRGCSVGHRCRRRRAGCRSPWRRAIASCASM